jgi:hypothetical protein
MNIEDVLNFTDSLVFAKKGKHLNDLQRIIIEAASSGSRYGYEEIAQASGYSPNYLKQDVGPKLWQLLSDVFGEKIKKNNFRATVERKAGLVETPILKSVDRPNKIGINNQDKICLNQTSLIETKENNFFLQQVLVEYISSLLIERVCKEIETGELVFLKNYPLIRIETNEYIKKAQVSFIVKPITDKLLTIFKNKKSLLVHLEELISKEQANFSDESSYAVENILNLLSQLQAN